MNSSKSVKQRRLEEMSGMLKGKSFSSSWKTGILTQEKKSFWRKN